MSGIMTINCLIKLGGAAITDKKSFETLNEETLNLCAKQLKARYDRYGVDFIVVHGAGSFGHFQASQSGVAKGGIEKDEVKKGFAETRLSVTKLNGMVVEALVKVGIPAVGLSLCGFWTTKDRQVSDGRVNFVPKMMDSGLVPVLHGDAVLDESLGCTILSGDVIIKHLAMELRPQKVVFLTNVDGVFNEDPMGNEKAELIRNIHVSSGIEDQWSIRDASFTSDPRDTTGGIEGKIIECVDIARSGFDVFICKAGSIYSRALLLEESSMDLSRWKGTVVSYKKK